MCSVACFLEDLLTEFCFPMGIIAVVVMLTTCRQLPSLTCPV